MKTLVLVRHAKAVDRHKHLSDMERALTLEGEKEAGRAAKKLKAAGVQPQLLISSPANRALETAHIFAKEFNHAVERIILKQAAYDARDAETLLSALRDIENHYDTVVLFGHNPSLSELAEALLEEFESNLPKSGTVVISISRDNWRDLLPGDGKPGIGKVESKAKSKAVESTSKELRRQLQPEIVTRLRQLVEDLHPGAAESLEHAIDEAGEALAKRLAKLMRRSTHQPAEPESGESATQ